jgi:hypothetical protein
MKESNSLLETIIFYKREAAIGLAGIGLTLGADLDKGFSWTFSGIGAIATAGMVTQSVIKKKKSKEPALGFADVKAYQFTSNPKHSTDDVIADEILTRIYDPEGITRENTSSNQIEDDDARNATDEDTD